MEHIPGQQSAHRADCKVKLYGMPDYPAPNPCNCEELDKAQYSVSMTRQDLQDQLDSNSELIARLTEALRKSEAEKGDLLAAAKDIVDWVDKLEVDTHDAITQWDPNKWEGLGEGFDINPLRISVNKALTSYKP